MPNRSKTKTGSKAKRVVKKVVRKVKIFIRRKLQKKKKKEDRRRFVAPLNYRHHIKKFEESHKKK